MAKRTLDTVASIGLAAVGIAAAGLAARAALLALAGAVAGRPDDVRARRRARTEYEVAVGTGLGRDGTPGPIGV